MGGDRWFSISFWVCCALLAVPLWSVEYLPMADLPQHAAQIAIWTRWSDPEFGYQQIYIQNWFTPYLLGYLLTFALTPFLSVKAALTTIITAAVVGVPLATRFLVRETGGNRWWVFAVFPSVFGFAFDWGFFSFLVGVPVAMVLLVFALRYAANPTRRSGVLLMAGLAGLFFVHVLLFLYVCLILGLTILSKREDWKAGLLSLAPIIVLAPLVLLWLYVTRNTETLTHRAMIWEMPGLTPRLVRLFSEVAGENPSPWTLFVGVFAFALPLFLGARPSRLPRRWIPFGATVVIFLLVPHEFLGTAWLYSRYVVFAIPTWLYAMEPKRDEAPGSIRLVLGPALAVTCTLMTTLQFLAYEPEVAGLKQVIDKMPANARVLSIPIRRNSRYFRTPVFLHTPVWYQAEKGGVVDFSFAINFPLLFRYRPETEPKIPRMFVWHPTRLNWDEHGASTYDYFVVRQFGKEPASLLPNINAPVTFVGRSGSWQLFRRN
jgi:hypothetical protein